MNQDPKNPKGGIAGRLNMAGWRKHYVAAMTADEDAWPQREPGSNLGRVFIILLLLHGFLIGAVVLYNVIAPKSQPALAAGKPVPNRPGGNKTPDTAAATKAPKAVAINPAADKTMVSLTNSPPAPGSEVKPVKTAIYDVRSGDNVPGIAAALGVSAEELIRLNNLDNTELYPGRKLSYPVKSQPPVLKAMPIPESLVSGNTAMSKTVSFNAVTPAKEKEKENSPPAPVKLKDNPVVSSADQPPVTKPSPKDEPSGGSRSKSDTPAESKTTKTASKSGKAPKSESNTKAASSKSESGNKTTSAKSESGAKTASKSEKTSSRRSHVVGPKETLYSIARKYGVKVDALQKANGIKDPTTLRDGMKLAIPSKD